MGSKQSSSTTNKFNKKQRKLSEDITQCSYFSPRLSQNCMYTGGNIKRPLSSINLCDMQKSNNCQKHIISDNLQTISNSSTLSVESSDLGKKILMSDQNSPFNSTFSDLETQKQQIDATEALFEKQRRGSVFFRWEFGGEKVYVVIVQDDEIIAKERLYSINSSYGIQQFEIEMDLEPGYYYYYYLVDGVRKYCAESEQVLTNDDQIVNFIIIPDLLQTEDRVSNLNNKNQEGSFFNFNSFNNSTNMMMWQDKDITIDDDMTTTTRTITTRPTNPCPKPLATCLKAAEVGVCSKVVVSKPKHHKRVHFQDQEAAACHQQQIFVQ